MNTQIISYGSTLDIINAFEAPYLLFKMGTNSVSNCIVYIL